jgi:hypothetical protein
LEIDRFLIGKVTSSSSGDTYPELIVFAHAVLTRLLNRKPRWIASFRAKSRRFTTAWTDIAGAIAEAAQHMGAVNVGTASTYRTCQHNCISYKEPLLIAI